jgi:hypothetical protein
MIFIGREYADGKSGKRKAEKRKRRGWGNIEHPTPNIEHRMEKAGTLIRLRTEASAGQAPALSHPMGVGESLDDQQRMKRAFAF